LGIVSFLVYLIITTSNILSVVEGSGNPLFPGRVILPPVILYSCDALMQIKYLDAGIGKHSMARKKGKIVCTPKQRAKMPQICRKGKTRKRKGGKK
jgi:hypothetical protein